MAHALSLVDGPVDGLNGIVAAIPASAFEEMTAMHLPTRFFVGRSEELEAMVGRTGTARFGAVASIQGMGGGEQFNHII